MIAETTAIPEVDLPAGTFDTGRTRGILNCCVIRETTPNPGILRTQCAETVAGNFGLCQHETECVP